MEVPFHPIEDYPGGMTVQEVDFPASAVSAAPFRATRIVVQAGGQSPVDKHAVTECWLAAEGTATMQLGDNSFALAAGNVVAIAPHVPHQVTNKSDSDFVFFSLWWDAASLS